ncbi:MAG TPA: hypothetical protein VGB54_15125 [Allosphingosinicella sp.]
MAVTLWRFIIVSLHVRLGRIVAGTNGGSAMSTQHWYWIAAGAAVVVAVFAGVADARRNRRDHLDRIGWVPWRGIQVIAAFALLVVLVLAVKIG